MGVSLNGGTPISHPKMIIFSRKTNGFVGETHHFRKPPNKGLGWDSFPRILKILVLTLPGCWGSLLRYPQVLECFFRKRIRTIFIFGSDQSFFGFMFSFSWEFKLQHGCGAVCFCTGKWNVEVFEIKPWHISFWTPESGGGGGEFARSE